MEEKSVGQRQKRGQGEGSYTKLPDGRVRWRTTVTSIAGERMAVSGTAKNMTEARKAVRLAREAAENESLVTRKDNMTVSNLVERYIDSRLRMGKIRSRTLEDYQYILQQYISQEIGGLKAVHLSDERLQKYFDNMIFKRSGSRTKQKVHGLLRASYKWGMQTQLVKRDPTVGGRPIIDSIRAAPKKESYNIAESIRFYNSARQDRWGWPLAFMLATGLRPGEALGLQWKDITFDSDGSAVIKIQRTLSLSQGKVYVGEPKTERSRRLFSIKGDAVEILRDCKKKSDVEAKGRLRTNGHDYQVTDYVFTSMAGTAYRPDNLRRPMRRICESASVPILTPHQLRHTYTSVMAASGWKIELLSKQLGHANVRTTQDFYRHILDDEQEDLTYDPTRDPSPTTQKS